VLLSASPIGSAIAAAVNPCPAGLGSLTKSGYMD